MPLRSLPALLALTSLASPASASLPSQAGPPIRLGSCAFTTVKRVETRLEERDHRPVPDSGSAVELANGVYGVSYDRVPAIDRSHAGDRVMTCLARLPRHCPAGDARGKWYVTTNLRTDEAWMLPDAEHMCGGA